MQLKESKKIRRKEKENETETEGNRGKISSVRKGDEEKVIIRILGASPGHEAASLPGCKVIKK